MGVELISLYEKHSVNVDNKGDMAVGVFFFPHDSEDQKQRIKSAAENILSKRSIEKIGWRQVPVDVDALGEIAQKSRPEIEHLLILRPDSAAGRGPGRAGHDFQPQDVTPIHQEMILSVSSTSAAEKSSARRPISTDSTSPLFPVA